MQYPSPHPSPHPSPDASPPLDRELPSSAPAADAQAARYAIYWAPAADSLLWRRGSAWLGRDAVADVALPRPAMAGFDAARLAALTAEPARYGLHATLKAPFRLQAPHTAQTLLAAAAAFAAARRPCSLPHLVVGTIGDFIALVPAEPDAALAALAEDCVRAFEPLRAPLSPAELQRRRQNGLSPRQSALLERWGYPFVLDQWRCHLTLTGRLAADELRELPPALTGLFGAALAMPTAIDAISVFVEPAPGRPLQSLARFALGADAAR